MEEREGKDNHGDFVDCFLKDIENYFASYTNRKFAIRQLSKLAGISQKTIERILAKSNNPSYQSIFKIYSVIYGTRDEKKIISLVPRPVKEILMKANPKSLKTEKLQSNLATIFANDPIASEIFILAGLSKININTVAYQFGMYGIKTLEELVEKEIIIQISKQEYILNPNHPELDGRALKELGLKFINRYSKPINTETEGQNILAFYAENLNEAGIKEWLRIDTEAFRRKVFIAKDSKYKGSSKFFTFMASDSMKQER